MRWLGYCVEVVQLLSIGIVVLCNTPSRLHSIAEMYLPIPPTMMILDRDVREGVGGGGISDREQKQTCLLNDLVCEQTETKEA